MMPAAPEKPDVIWSGQKPDAIWIDDPVGKRFAKPRRSGKNQRGGRIAREESATETNGTLRPAIRNQASLADGAVTDAGKFAAGGKMQASWTRPLRVLLSLLMVVLLVTVSTVLIGLDYQRARSVAIKDATERMRIFSERAADQFRILLGDTTGVVGLASVSNIFARPPPDRLDEKVAFLRQAIMASPHIDGAYAGYPDGAFVHVVGLGHSPGWRRALDAPSDASIAVRSIERRSDGARLSRWTFLDADGLTLKEGSLIAANFDPRTRPWYQAALGNSFPVSTAPYRGATTGAIDVSIAQAHRADRNVVIGVDVLLDTIERLLAEERISPGAIAFVVDRTGTPVISSELHAPDISSTQMLWNAIVAERFPDKTARFLRVSDRTYVTRASAIDPTSMLEGSIVVAAPLEELTAAARMGMRQGLLVSALILAAGIVAVLLVANWITRALQSLTVGADRLRRLDFDSPVEVRSHVAEISALGDAMGKGLEAIRTFGLYVPKELVRRMVDTGQFTGRSADRQEITAMFSDIYDFTAICEQHSPEKVVKMLSEYFDVFSDVVGEHGGAIIQFHGDSVFAMWNAPIFDSHHAAHACACALTLKTRLDDFNAAQRSHGRPELKTRFGIHSGSALVGSVGAKERLQYTGMGDTLNVASRLEGMNKEHGSTILVSGAVVAACGQEFSFLPLGLAHAKGRTAELEIYELDGVPPEERNGPRPAISH